MSLLPHAITLVAAGFLVLTLLTGVAAYRHLTGAKVIRAPYDKWIVGTFFFGIISNGAYVVKKAIQSQVEPPQVATLACSASAGSIINEKTLGDAMKQPACRQALMDWLRPFAVFSANDSALVDALAAVIPNRKTGDTEASWRAAIGEAVQNHAALKILRQRAQNREIPFVSETINVDIGKPDQKVPKAGAFPATGSAYVSSKELDEKLIIVLPAGRDACKLTLKARYAMPEFADRDPPLLHINPQQEKYLLGRLMVGSTEPANIVFASTVSDIVDPSRSSGCSLDTAVAVAR